MRVEKVTRAGVVFAVPGALTRFTDQIDIGSFPTVTHRARRRFYLRVLITSFRVCCRLVRSTIVHGRTLSPLCREAREHAKRKSACAVVPLTTGPGGDLRIDKGKAEYRWMRSTGKRAKVGPTKKEGQNAST